jgi:hypothetical protein
MTRVTYRRARWVAAAGVGLLGACGGDAASGPPADLDAVTLDTLFEIGAVDGESWETFGGIWAVEGAADGRFAVLDIDASAVHVYDDTGRHVGSIDEVGLEEGQLDTPTGLAWSAPGELLVWDPGSSWVSRFAVSGSAVRFEDRFLAFAFGETGFCASDGRTYLSYWQDGQVVHEIGPQGLVRSFGPAPSVVGMETLGPELQEIATEELTPSALLCTSHGLMEASFMQSQVRMYDWDGDLVWGRELADFRPIYVYTPDGMGLGRGFDTEQGSHLLRSIVAWGDDMALLQYELRTQEIPEEGEVEVIESRLVRLVDGEEVARTRTLPVILSAQGSRLYLVETDPFPKVIVTEAR